MKKFIAAATTAVLMTCSFVGMAALPVNATVIENEITPYSYASYVNSDILISNKVATMTSKVTGKSGTTKVMVTQYLQKKVGTDWAQVTANVKTFNSSSAYYSNKSSTLYSGTYRVKTVAQVYKGTAYETITVYSSTASC